MAGRPRTTSEIISGLLVLIARVAAVGLLLSLAYTLFIVFSGSLKQFPVGWQATASNTAMRDMTLAGQVVTFCSACLAVSIGLLWYGEGWVPVAYLITAVLLYIALPRLGLPYMSAAALSLERRNHPGAEVLSAWWISGGMFGVAAIIMLTGMALEHLKHSLTAPRRAAGTVKLPFYSPCWQTHYCKPEINKLCAPGKSGYRKSCWRHKSGCFCDNSIGDRVLADARKSAGKDAADWFGAAAPAPKASFSDHFKSTRYRVPGQRIACADCPIYNFHELQKHRILAPIALVAVPALMYWRSDILDRFYQSLVAGLDRFTLHLAFTPEGTAVISNQIHNALAVRGIEVLLFVSLALVLITSVTRALEFLCFSAKL